MWAVEIQLHSSRLFKPNQVAIVLTIKKHIKLIILIQTTQILSLLEEFRILNAILNKAVANTRVDKSHRVRTYRRQSKAKVIIANSIRL